MRKKPGEWVFVVFWVSGLKFGYAHVAQLAEHVLGKDEVISSILIMGSIAEKKSVWQLHICIYLKNTTNIRRFE